MADTKHVRLPERLTNGNITDLESGWHIGGFDVKEVPDKEENPAAHSFVTSKLRQGHLEAATPEEHEVVQKSRKDMTELHLSHLDLGEALDRAGHQEQPLQDAGGSARRQLKKLRSNDPQEQKEASEAEVEAKRVEKVRDDADKAVKKAAQEPVLIVPSKQNGEPAPA